MRNEIANFKNCKSIAIMGGTFDPIHYGHLVTAEAVRHRFQVDKVVFIPTGKPAHKTDKAVTHNEHRYLMAVLATMRNENFEVSRIEIDRPGFTYTIDTIEQLKKTVPPRRAVIFYYGSRCHPSNHELEGIGTVVVVMRFCGGYTTGISKKPDV